MLRVVDSTAVFCRQLFSEYDGTSLESVRLMFDRRDGCLIASNNHNVERRQKQKNDGYGRCFTPSRHDDAGPDLILADASDEAVQHKLTPRGKVSRPDYSAGATRNRGS
jgi:hypothetical protein